MSVVLVMFGLSVVTVCCVLAGGEGAGPSGYGSGVAAQSIVSDFIIFFVLNDGLLYML